MANDSRIVKKIDEIIADLQDLKKAPEKISNVTYNVTAAGGVSIGIMMLPSTAPTNTIKKA